MTNAIGRPRLLLEPGQIIRMELFSATANGSSHNKRFYEQERYDYHASVKTVNGKRWLYIWRDPVEADQGVSP